MKIEINGHQIEVDDSFSNLSEDEQHRQIDEIAGSLPNAQPAVDSPAPEHITAEASVAPNVAAGGEAALLSMGVGLPKAAFHAAKNYFGGTPSAAPAPTNIPGEERWFGSANAINEKAKIIRRNNELAKRFPGFERKLVEDTTPPLQKVVGGLNTLRTTTPGKAFVSGYNAMDVGKHAGEGALGNAQAGLSAAATAAPFAEKYLPGKYKKIAKIGALATPAINYAIDKLVGPSPEPEQKATGGLIQNFAGGKEVIKKLSEILTPHEGKTLLATMADRTKATEGFHGGPGFINLHPDYTWAVDAPAVAKKHMEAVQRFGGPDQTLMAPMLMSREAHKSNRPVFEQIYGDVQNKIKSGELTPEQIAALDARIRAEKAVDLTKNPGLTDPNFLEFANAFNRRGKLADILGLKRSGAVDLQKHLDQTIDPALREAETGAIGPQLFTMSDYEAKPGVHPAYDIMFHGEKGEGKFAPAPREFVFRDLEKQAREQMGRPMTDYNYRNILKEHGGIPNQLIDEKLLRGLDELGHKKGGKVKKKKK
jgi:hypothetical protein